MGCCNLADSIGMVAAHKGINNRQSREREKRRRRRRRRRGKMKAQQWDLRT